jgi:hypothetical protein
LYGARSSIAGHADWRRVKEGTAGVIVRMSDLSNKSIGTIVSNTSGKGE